MKLNKKRTATLLSVILMVIILFIYIYKSPSFFGGDDFLLII